MERASVALALVVSAALLLVPACGGGGGGGGGEEPIPPSPTPHVWGTITDTDSSGGGGVHMTVPGAHVVLVPAGAVEEIDSIQPMEDAAKKVVAGTLGGGYSTTSDAAGKYSFTGVADGDYFLVVLPVDGTHLPGGHRKKVAVSGDVLADVSQGDVELSTTPSASATYVGSTTCLACHQKTSLKHTLHFIGLRKIAADGSVIANGLMDLNPSPDTYGLMGNIQKTMALFTPDTQGGPTKYTLAGTTFDTYLGIDASGPYFQVGSNVNPKFRVHYTYGGETGKWKARFMTLVDAATRGPAELWGADNIGAKTGYGYYEMAPMQFQETYTDGSNGVSGPFVAYHSDRWDFAGGGLFLSDPKAKSWDANCATCHGGTGIDTSSGEYVAMFPVDANGYDLHDLSGKKYEINLGCEKCHGPGSEHVAGGGQGKNIVHPDLLTAGRLTMICGTCHIRGDNNTVVGGEPSLIANGTTLDVFRPGKSPAEHFGTTDGAGIAPFETDSLTNGYLSPINFLTSGSSWKDLAHEAGNPFVTSTAAGNRTQVTASFNHSSGHHQQFMDLVRTKMFKNDNQLVTCIDCHDAHGSGFEHQLQADGDNNALCLRCHNSGLRAPGQGETAPDESKEGKHPANFQFITQAMSDRLDGGTTSPADDQSISSEVMRHVGKWANYSSMGSEPYDPDGGSKMGRCTVCHMSKTAKSASWSNALNSSHGNQYVEGDIHSHTFDVLTREAIHEMFNAVANTASKVTPAGMTNSCGTCHTPLVD